jgi:hypothetical protein
MQEVTEISDNPANDSSVVLTLTLVMVMQWFKHSQEGL